MPPGASHDRIRLRHLVSLSQSFLATRLRGAGVRIGVALIAAVCISARPLEAQPGLGLGDMQQLSRQISFRVWTVENGLPQSSVTKLRLDKAGYVWGTTFGGLFRFDGRTVRQYTAADVPAISGNSVNALDLMPNGDLLVGTPNGTIVRLRDGRMLDTLPSPGLDNASLDVMVTDGADGVWVRRGDRVQHFHDGRWEPPVDFSGSTALLRDAQGRVTFAGASGVVRVEPDGHSRVLSRQPVLSLGQEYGAFIDHDGRFWIGAADGLWVFEDGAGARRVLRTDTTVNVIMGDGTGTLWVGSGGKLFRFDSRNPDARLVPLLDVKARLVSMVRTHDGLLVLGTLEGLVLIRENFINVLESKRAIPAIETGSLASNGDSTIWVTSSCSDALRLDRRGNVLDSMPRANPGGCTRSLALDARERIWSGGDGAIRRRGPDGERVWTVDTLPPGAALVRPLLVVGDSLLFGVTDGRVGVITPDDRLDFLPGWSTRTGRAVESMTRDRQGALWVAQMGRLSKLSARFTVTFSEAARIPRAVPRALYADSAGGLWIGTYGSGLWYFREGRVARQVPVIDQTVSAVFESTGDRVWMPGNRGLTVVTMSSLREWVVDSTRVPDVRLLSYTEGVPEGNIGYPAAARLAEGVLAFASVTGLVVVHTPGVVTVGETPAVQFDAIRSTAGPLQLDGDRYVVEPEARAVYATFSTPAFRFGDVVSFRYRLDDGPWIMLGNARDLQVTLPRPGRYRLALEGRVPGGKWRPAPSLEFDARPLFLEQAWPRWLFAALVAGLLGVLAAQRSRTARLAARTREIELHARRDAALLAERHQREMAQVSRVAVAGELTASISHEIGQPLAAIVNNAEVARRLLARTVNGGVDPRVEQSLLDVVAQGRRASQVVREFRRFLKRERGEREAVDVRDLIDSAAVLLQSEYTAHGVQLTVQVEAAPPVIVAERVLLQQVLVNLLYNALEATRRLGNGQVLVRARPSGGGVRVTVADNGTGFAADVRRSAFEPFVTTRENGMGMGLAIARRVVEAHGGHIAVGHLGSAGAVVSLWLPTSHVPLDRSDSLVPLQVTVHE